MSKPKQKFSFALFYQKYGVVILLLIIFAAAALLNKNFLKPANLRNVLKQMVIITVIASGGCYILVCGQLNIAYDGLIAFLGCMACIIMVAVQNVVVAVLATILMGAVIGWMQGAIMTTFKIPGFIVGLAIKSIVVGAIMLITGGVKIVGMNESFTFLGKGTVGPIPMNVIIALLCMLACNFLLTKTSFGRRVFAVGGNKQAAIASGINANSIIRRVYALDGVTTAIASILFMARLGSGQPSAGAGYAFNAIAGAVIGGCSIYGGKGSVLGCLIGAAIISILNNLLSLMNVSSYWQDIFSGCIILLSVLVDLATKKAATVATKNLMAK